MGEYELYHHGVKGQRWGVRRYQDKSGRLTPAGKIHVREGMSDKDVFKDMKKIQQSSHDAPEDMVKDAIAVNGGVRGYALGFNRNWNCAFCATAYELRRRGQDVHSQESLEGVNRDATKAAYMNIKKSDIHSEATRKTGKTMHIGMTQDEFKDMEHSILKDGDNSRGRMNVNWKAYYEGGTPTGGHAFNYEVKNGKFYIVDPQVGKVLSGRDAYSYMSSAINVEHFRTDNKKVNNRISNKYFVESNSDIRINDEKEKFYKSYERDKKIQKAMAGTAYVSYFSAFGGLMSGNAPVTAAGAAGFTASLVTSAASTNSVKKHGKAANEAQRKASLELEKKWDAENRMEFYETGKEKKSGGKKKK